jgi:hypothetical protein
MCMVLLGNRDSDQQQGWFYGQAWLSWRLSWYSYNLYYNYIHPSIIHSSRYIFRLVMIFRVINDQYTPVHSIPNGQTMCLGEREAVQWAVVGGIWWFNLFITWYILHNSSPHPKPYPCSVIPIRRCAVAVFSFQPNTWHHTWGVWSTDSRSITMFGTCIPAQTGMHPLPYIHIFYTFILFGKSNKRHG